MKRFSLKAWGLFAIAASCLILYLCFAPKPYTSTRRLADPSASPNTESSTTTHVPSGETSSTPAEASPASDTLNPATNAKTLLSDLPDPGERVGIRGHGILLRAQAGLKAEVVRESEAGESFYTTGQTAIADDLAWVELELSPGTKAWISKGFIQRQRNMPAFNPLPLAKASPSASQSAKTADPALENPHLKSAAYWAKYPARVRQDISMKLAQEILKSSPGTYTSDHAIALEACIDESSKAPDLQTLKIYELASTCAIALNWT
jgi:hypothetical protein